LYVLDLFAHGFPKRFQRKINKETHSLVGNAYYRRSRE
jgi:hypothetical protein